MLNKKYLILLFLWITIALASCSSSVRFAQNDQSNTNKKNNSKNLSKSNKSKSNKNYSEDKTKYSKITKAEHSTDKNQSEKSSKKGNSSKNIFDNQSQITGIRKNIFEEAKTWIGTPYNWGGESRSGADCSGFVMSVFKSAGISLPRTAAEQYTVGKNVSLSDAKVGDLVFFSKGDSISHVGIYIGDNSILHSSSSKGVIVQHISTMGTNPTFTGVKSIIKN